jgi:hypothetical protein
MTDKPDFYLAGDYAGLTAKNAQFYYGYEQTDSEGNWCFVATIGENEIIIPSTKLGVENDFDVVECLMAGIGWVLAKYELVPTGKDE